MTTSDLDRIIDKVQKLLAKAEGTTNEVEAGIFMAKVEALMREYAISEEQLRQDDPAMGRDIVVKSIPLAERDQLRRAKLDLYNVLASFNHCRLELLVTSKRDGINKARATLIGHSADVQFVELLWASVWIQLTNAKQQGFAAYRDAGGTESRFKYHKSFASAFVHRVMERLNAEAARQSSSEPGTALVLANRLDAVDEFIRSLFGSDEGTLARGKTSHIDAAAAAGFAAATSADLSGGRNALR